MNNLLNFKSFLKFLKGNKAYTAIDIFGLSVSLMFVILIAVYTVQELSTDKFHEYADRIYVLGNEDAAVSGVPVAYRLQERYPEIEKICPVISHNFDGQIVRVGDKKLNADFCFADSSFFNFFSFELLSGDRNEVLKARNSAVISETFAHKLFGLENPIGQSIRISDSTDVSVTGIMKDIKNSVIPYADLLMRIEGVGEFNPSLSMNSYNNAGATTAFLMVKPGADLVSKTDDIYKYLKEIFWTYRMDVWKQVTLTPLKELYFSNIKSNGNSGDKRFVMVLMSVGILILIFAVFNYINLTVAQAGQRAKEMATRRLLGSSRKELFMRLMMESTLLTFISFIIGLLFAIAVIPYANDLLQTRISLMDVCSPGWIISGFLLILLIGMLAGFLPAILVSSSKPIDVVRGTFRRQTKMVFSKCFITFQNAITISMIAASIVMILQIDHLVHAPLGYNTTNILETSNSFLTLSERIAAIDQVKQLPFVKRVGFTRGMPFSGSNNLTGTYEDKTLSFQQFIMDSVVFNILGLEIIRDNHLASPSWYISEKAMHDMELPDDAPTFKWGTENVPIAGILRNFQPRGNVTTEDQPVMLYINEPKNINPWSIIIEVDGNLFTAYDEIRKIYEKVSGVGFEAKFIDQQIQESFEAQKRLAKIVVIFACIAVLISLLGLLAMSTYFIQQRAQEIAIRKVFGSDNQAILLRLVRTFLNYVGIAFIIATPIIWYLMEKWLSDYSYRIDLSPLIFVAAGLFCLLTSFAAVFVQSWRAANTNPVENVKAN
ncbi:ABC transporter permease [Parabacteroides sp. AM08-6]|uniref:ABC transporter permease n=1 Tax=Parabacteroides sp. AM08-6 TaxID=2292053 RepID=UPI000EFE1703|nr:ABC transporter permease [Parabacteroides sp. AM08-6]RHJ78886.1 ABC transporter permease [Parabacteroides sp. AM08-6]